MNYLSQLFWFLNFFFLSLSYHQKHFSHQEHAQTSTELTSNEKIHPNLLKALKLTFLPKIFTPHSPNNFDFPSSRPFQLSSFYRRSGRQLILNSKFYPCHLRQKTHPHWHFFLCVNFNLWLMKFFSGTAHFIVRFMTYMYAISIVIGVI